MVRRRFVRCSPRWALLVVLILVTSGCDDAPCATCHTTPSSFDAALAETLTQILEDNLRASSAPGATLTVHLPGQGTFAAGAGTRDASAMLPMEPRTRFRVGSITKTFNAAAILLLAEDGVLSLDDRASDWVTLDGLDSAITVRQLLSHQAGIHNYTDDVSFLNNSMSFWEPEDVVEWSLDRGTVHPPGVTYHYSNTGFFITGLVMEAATGQRFDQIVRDRLLDPLRLRDTSEESNEGRDPDMSEGYVISAGSPATDSIDMSWAWAAGGIVSSGVDLCRWAEMVYRGDVLPSSARSAMIGPEPGSVGVADATYGYGLGTRHTTRGGRQVIGHTGSTMGFKGELFIDPATGACVAVMTNDFTSTPSAISNPAWQALAAHLPAP